MHRAFKAPCRTRPRSVSTPERAQVPEAAPGARRPSSSAPPGPVMPALEARRRGQRRLPEHEPLVLWCRHRRRRRDRRQASAADAKRTPPPLLWATRRRRRRRQRRLRLGGSKVEVDEGAGCARTSARAPIPLRLPHGVARLRRLRHPRRRHGPRQDAPVDHHPVDLMCQGFDGRPTTTHSIVACPVSLVTNWESELTKWIKEHRLKARGIGSSQSARRPRRRCKMINRYSTPLGDPHHLVRDVPLHQALQARRRESASSSRRGPPPQEQGHEDRHRAAWPPPTRACCSRHAIQNDSASSTRWCISPTRPPRQRARLPQLPEPHPARARAAPPTGLRARRAASELGRICNQFILRRTNTLLSDHLPPKLVTVVCCSMSKLQLDMYRAFLQSKAKTPRTAAARRSSSRRCLAWQLCNHPALIVDHGKAARV